MFRIHRLRRGETDMELLVFLFTVVGAGAAWVWFRIGLPTPRCNLNMLTGIPCPTCGGTRALRGFLTGDWWLAWTSNPLVFAGFVVWSVFATYAAVVSIGRLPRLRLRQVGGTGRRGVWAGMVAVLLANWIYLLVQQT